MRQSKPPISTVVHSLGNDEDAGERKEFASHDTTIIIIITVNTPIQSAVAVASLCLTRNGAGGGNRLTLVLLTSAFLSPRLDARSFYHSPPILNRAAAAPLFCPFCLFIPLILLLLFCPSVGPSATFLSGFTGELLLLLVRSLRCIALLTQFPRPPPPPAMALRPSLRPSVRSVPPSVRRPQLSTAIRAPPRRHRNALLYTVRLRFLPDRPRGA